MAGVGWKDAVKFASAAMLSRHRPLLAHLVVTRYCNLDCTYCSEFDKVSKPVPIDALLARIDRLADLGTVVVTLTGGEPLTHPEHETVIARIRARGMVATTITNGFLLTEQRIRALNAAGLQELQISIDGVFPDDVSKKSLKSLMGKLELLASHASFHININSVLGITEERTRDALEVSKTAKKLGFSHTVGVLHDANGTLAPLSADQQRVYAALMHAGSLAHRFNYHSFQKNLMAGKPNDWRCRAGARYLYICEEGLVHYCSQQRGTPGIPLLHYGSEDIRRESDTVKACAPFCTVSCVHQASFLDRWRSQKQAPVPAQ
jgi:MoaA/NifB/PqqE/SkfB family radical SAM enzyme